MCDLHFILKWLTLINYAWFSLMCELGATLRKRVYCFFFFSETRFYSVAQDFLWGPGSETHYIQADIKPAIIFLLSLLHLIHLRVRTVVMSHHACLLGEGFVAFCRGKERWESEQMRQEDDTKEFPLPLSWQWRSEHWKNSPLIKFY